MSETTLNDILADFDSTNAQGEGSLKGGKPVTIWLPLDAKEDYDRLQECSGRKFGKKAREALLALISAAKSRTA